MIFLPAVFADFAAKNLGFAAGAGAAGGKRMDSMEIGIRRVAG